MKSFLDNRKVYVNIETFESDLIDHYEQHSLKNIRCPDCPERFDNLANLVDHFTEHKGLHMIEKPECDADLGLPECKHVTIDGYSFFPTARCFAEGAVGNTPQFFSSSSHL